MEYLISRYSITTDVTIFQEKLESFEVNTPVRIDNLTVGSNMMGVQQWLLSPAILATYSLAVILETFIGYGLQMLQISLQRFNPY